MPDKKLSYHSVRQAEYELEDLKAAYLHQWGWLQKHDTPIGYYLWQRDFSDVDKKYGVITTNTHLAIMMTVNCLEQNLWSWREKMEG